jgi:hypothetical protein
MFLHFALIIVNVTSYSKNINDSHFGTTQPTVYELIPRKLEKRKKRLFKKGKIIRM